MKFCKSRQRGEIAVLLTIAVLLVVGATTFISSLALKGKKTVSTKAVEGCNSSTVGQCFSGLRCTVKVSTTGLIYYFKSDASCPTPTPEPQLNPPVWGENKGNECGSGGPNYQFGSCYKGSRCVQCQHGGRWLSYNCFEIDRSCPGSSVTQNPIPKPALTSKPTPTTPPPTAIPTSSSNNCWKAVCPPNYEKGATKYCFKTVNNRTFYYIDVDDDDNCNDCTGNVFVNRTDVCGKLIITSTPEPTVTVIPRRVRNYSAVPLTPRPTLSVTLPSLSIVTPTTTSTATATSIPIETPTLTPIPIFSPVVCNKFYCYNNTSLPYIIKCANPGITSCGGQYSLYSGDDCDRLRTAKFTGTEKNVSSYAESSYCINNLRKVKIDIKVKISDGSINYSPSYPSASFKICYSELGAFAFLKTVCPISETIDLSNTNDYSKSIEKTINVKGRLRYFLFYNPAGLNFLDIISGELQENSGQIIGDVDIN